MTVLLADQFIPAVQASIPRFRANAVGQPSPDAEQVACILHPNDRPLQIVAGPGSGKTTVLVLRALRHVLVDGLLPEQVLLTTFTKKAAEEIRTRLIEWGIQLTDHLRQTGSQEVRDHLARVDVNRFVTGTLDSVCDEAVRTLRAPTDPAPVLLEGFAADALMYRRGLSDNVYANGALDPEIGTFLSPFTFAGDPPANSGELIKAVRPLFDRFAHDSIDLAAFSATATHTTARQKLVAAYAAYVDNLRADNRLDFALLEKLFLERLVGNRLSRLTNNLRALLVDEYQDTNLLQETIYFRLFVQSGCSITVVGDDDQSLYRFRGATVELFRDFHARLAAAGPGVAVSRLYLSSNYRSPPPIVELFNAFILNDPDFEPARVAPPKPRIVSRRPSNGVRVLGMFRDEPSTLASDVAQFLHDIFRGAGRAVGGVNICRSPQGGDFGDAVLLGHSINEYTAGFRGGPPRARFPQLLRDRLRSLGVGVFNPRGQALRDIPDVQRLLGAMLECFDPGGALQQGLHLRNATKASLTQFRTEYQQYASSNPPPNAPHRLANFVGSWGIRQAQPGATWPREWPVLEVCFKLLSWFPRLRDDPEGQIHLEAVARAIAQSAAFSPYRSQILNGAGGPHDARSVESAIRDIFAPLADGAVDVDEDVMPHVPRDRLAIMTIHQAKGLEFPLVLVDVSSDFTTNHASQRFKRFPEEPSPVTLLENDISGACPIGALRSGRSAIQRTFEDLIRLYYVAYSRPQSLLVLVGLASSLRYNTSIRNIATFWRRDGTWPWIGPYATRRPPPQANALPTNLELI